MYHISRDKRSEQSAKMIYDALSQLLKTKELKSILISDIATEAGVGRTTFYRCFDAIDDVLQYQSDIAFDHCGEYLHQMVIIEAHYRPEDTFIKPVLDYWSSHFSIIENLIRLNRVDIIQSSFRRMMDSLKALYPHIEIPYYDYFAEVRIAIAVAILTQWVKDNRKVSSDELIIIFKDQFLLDQILYDLTKGNGSPN